VAAVGGFANGEHGPGSMRTMRARGHPAPRNALY